MMRAWLYRPVRGDEWEAIDLLFLFEMAIQGSVISIPDVLLHKRVGGTSSAPPARTPVEAFTLRLAIARAYAARIRRSSLGRLDQALLHASLAMRTLVSFWEWKYYFAYTLLVVIDPKRRIRRHLRGPWEQRVVRHAGE